MTTRPHDPSRRGAPSARRVAHGYRRDAATWVAYAALFAFGVVNALLGPALPYLRHSEGISYLAGAAYQAAYAVGGLCAGILATGVRSPRSRRATICTGLTGAAVAGLGLGYGSTFAVTVGAALLLSLLATTALIRVWAALADMHHAHRAVAMTEGEVVVSLAGVLTPMAVGGLALTVLTWRFSFVVAAIVVVLAAVAAGLSSLPAEAAGPVPQEVPPRERRSRPHETLVIVFSVVALEFTLSFWAASYLYDDVGLARDTAVAMVSGLYAANLVGRLLASRLARRTASVRVLVLALAAAFTGVPVLLAAHGTVTAAAGLAIMGLGIGATFPLTSALHVSASPKSADRALGEILTTAGIGQIAGPLVAGALAQATNLRIGLLVLPALIVVGAAALAGHVRWAGPGRPGRA